MTLRIDAGWDFDKVGSFSLQFTDSGGSDTITISTGQYCHTDITSVMGNGVYSDFATKLQADLNASGTLAGAYTVTYTGGTTAAFASGSEGYRIQCDENFTTADPSGTLAGQILGLTGAVGSTQDKWCDVRPYYTVVASGGAKSAVTDDYEPDNVADGGWSLGGSHYTVSAQTAITFHDFDLQYEAKAATFKRDAVASVPWTYQHLWEHCRGDEPMLVADGTDDTVHYLRPEGAAWKPARAAADWDGAWSIPFVTFMEGRL